MKTREVISIDGRQAVNLPDGFRFTDATVSIRKVGNDHNFANRDNTIGSSIYLVGVSIGC